MTIFQAILFVLSCLFLIFSTVQIALACVTALCQAIATKNTKATDMTVQVWLAALSFSYIMAYLFIW